MFLKYVIIIIVRALCKTSVTTLFFKQVPLVTTVLHQAFHYCYVLHFNIIQSKSAYALQCTTFKGKRQMTAKG